MQRKLLPYSSTYATSVQTNSDRVHDAHFGRLAGSVLGLIAIFDLQDTGHQLIAIQRFFGDLLGGTPSHRTLLRSRRSRAAWVAGFLKRGPERGSAPAAAWAAPPAYVRPYVSNAPSKVNPCRLFSAHAGQDHQQRFACAT